MQRPKAKCIPFLQTCKDTEYIRDTRTKEQEPNGAAPVDAQRKAVMYI